MKANRLGSVPVVLPVLLALGGTAAAADNTIAVLGIEASDGAPDAVAAALTDALRQRASAERSLKLVPGKDLIEVKLIYSCPDEAPSCMSEAAKSLGAAKMIFGGVKKAAGDSYVVTLKMLDAGRRQVDSWVAEQITKAQAAPASIRGPVQKWFATLTGQSAVGVIKVKSDVPGASLTLDGAPVGVTATDEVVINNVAAGRHELLASKVGHSPARRDVTVTAGSTAEVSIQMGGGAAPATTTPTNGNTLPVTGPPVPTPTVSSSAGEEPPTLVAKTSPRRGGSPVMRAATWGTLVAGLASFGLALKFGLDVREINEDLDQYRRFKCASSIPPERARFGCNIEGEPATAPLTDMERKFVKDNQEEGERFQKYQYVAIGVGSALVVASGVFFYMGYLSDNGSVAVGEAKLQLAPMASANGGGAIARLTF